MKVDDERVIEIWERLAHLEVPFYPLEILEFGRPICGLASINCLAAAEDFLVVIEEIKMN